MILRKVVNLPSDEGITLIERARCGDEAAFEEIFLLYRERLFGAAYHLCNFDRETALDLVQDVFVKVYEKLDTFNGRCRLYTWIYRIMLNLYLANRRRQWIRDKCLQVLHLHQVQEIELPPQPLEHLEQKETRQRFLYALRYLSPKQEMVLKLKIFGDLTIGEIAEMTEMSEGTVKSHLFRAVYALKRRLRDCL